jgi:hypothetical protein
MLSNRATIAEAIRRLTVIEFGYDGYRRVYWPYILGETKSGELEVFGWQTLSGKGGAADFRQFRLSGLTGLIATARCFERPSPRVDPEKRGFVRVFARI